MKEISIVPSDGVNGLWQTVEPMIARALARAPGRWDTIDILVELLAGRQQLWIVIEETIICAAYTTRISEVPGGRILTVEWLGGDGMFEWIDEAIETTEAFAKDMKCKKIEAHGRKGWKQTLADHGWDEVAVTYEKDLNNG